MRQVLLAALADVASGPEIEEGQAGTLAADTPAAELDDVLGGAGFYYGKGQRQLRARRWRGN
jgi:hypothetical protein